MLLKTLPLLFKEEVPYIYLQSVQVSQVSAHINDFLQESRFSTVVLTVPMQMNFLNCNHRYVLKMKLRHLWF